MNLPVYLKIIICEYVVQRCYAIAQIGSLDYDSILPEIYLQAIFGDEYTDFMYLIKKYTDVYNCHVRHLVTHDCEKLKLCNHLLRLHLIENDIEWKNLPNSLVELRCYSLPKKLSVNLKTLILESPDISLSDLPDSLEALFLTSYSKEIVSLPSSLKTLVLYNFNKPFIFRDALRPSVLLSDLHMHSRQSSGALRPSMLPSDARKARIETSEGIKLKFLYLGGIFNNSVIFDSASALSLEQLIFGARYNKPVCLDNLISLKILIFGTDFDKEVRMNKLTSLEHLDFGKYFNWHIYDYYRTRTCRYIINSLFVILMHYFFGDIKWCIADIIGIILKFYRRSVPVLFVFVHVAIYGSLYFAVSCMCEHDMATKLHVREFGSSASDVPILITLVVIIVCCILAFGVMSNIYFFHICILINNSCSISNVFFIIMLFNSVFWYVVKKILWKKITRHYSYLPPNVKLIKLTYFWEHFFLGVLPNSVTHLYFTTYFNSSLSQDVIVGNYAYLSICQFINRLFSIKTLPDKLEYLQLPNCYNQRIYKYQLPRSLKTLAVPRTYVYMENLEKLSVDMKFELLVHD